VFPLYTLNIFTSVLYYYNLATAKQSWSSPAAGARDTEKEFSGVDWLSDQDIIDMFYVVGAPSARLSQERNPISCACGGLREMPPGPRAAQTCKRTPDPRDPHPHPHPDSGFKIQLLNYELVQKTGAGVAASQRRLNRRGDWAKNSSLAKRKTPPQKRATGRKIIIANLCQVTRIRSVARVCAPK